MTPLHLKLFRRESQGGHLEARTSQSQTHLGLHVQSQSYQVERLESREQEEVGGEGEEARTSRTHLGHHLQGLEVAGEVEEEEEECL